MWPNPTAFPAKCQTFKNTRVIPLAMLNISILFVVQNRECDVEEEVCDEGNYHS